MVRRSTGKISPDLADQLEAANPGEPIEVIVELEPPRAPTPTGTRAQRVAERRRNFDETLASVAGHLEPAGGKILDSAWINSTLRAELTSDQIRHLESQELVRCIDSPRVIHAEA